MPQASKSAGEKGPSPTGRLVLVVEDEPSQLELLAVTLEDRGYRVLRADGGAAALNLGEALGEVDLVVADVVIPEMSGVELVERLRRITREGLPAIYVTGYSPQDDERARPILSKPVSSDRLVAAVENALDNA